MGSKTTPVAAAGILVPWPFATSREQSTGDYDVGTDYTEADPAWGRGVWSGTGTPPVGLWPSGEPDAGASLVRVRYVRGGGEPGVVAQVGSGQYMGRDNSLTLTGYQAATTDALRSLDAVAASDGTVTAIGTVTSGGTCTYSVGRRTTAGAWSWSTLTSYATSAQLGACLCRLPDGGLAAYLAVPAVGAAGYTVEMWRSDDDGASWVLQTTVACELDAAARILRATAVGAGQVLLCATSGTGTATEVEQLVSVDGGFTFAQVEAPTSRRAVWGAVWTGGAAFLLVEEQDTTDKVRVRRIADATASIWASANPVTLRTSNTTAYTAGGTIWDDLDGHLHAAVVKDSGLVVYWSDDYGATWAEHDDMLEVDGGTADTLGEPVACVARGQVIMLGQVWDGSAIDAGTVPEIRFGGNSDVTPSYWPYRLPSAPSRAWVPLDGPGNADWSISSVGVIAVSLSRSLGYSVTTDAGETWTATQSPTVSSAGSTVTWDTITVVSGSVTVKAGAGAGPRRGVAVDLTSTQIRAYDASGAAGAYTNHGITGAVQIMIVVSQSTAKGAVYYRAGDQSDERAWTTLATLTGLGDSTGIAVHTVDLPASSQIRWLAATTDHGTLHPLADGVSRPADLAPMPLGGGGQRYIAGGLVLAERGGSARVDGSSWEFRPASPHPKAALLPQVSPSPRRGWRSDGTATQSLVFTLDPASATPADGGSDLWAIYLDKLESVPRIKVYEGATLIQTVDLRIPISYSASGATVVMSSSGASAPGPWVAPGELAGGYFQGATGSECKIIGNTGGSLTSGSTVAEKRATLRLDVAASSASGSGYIWPPRAVLLWYRRGSTALESVTLEIDGAEPAHADGYRAIGIAAIGPVHVLGRAWDRTQTLELTPGDEIQTLPDGSRYAVNRMPNRRRLEVAIVDSHVDVSQVRGLTASPDYVVVSSHASADPAADRYGDPLALQGLIDEIGRSPVVVLPYIPIDSGSGDAIVARVARRCDGALYARLTNASRIEQVQAGVTGVSDLYRVPVLAWEEEL